MQKKEPIYAHEDIKFIIERLEKGEKLAPKEIRRIRVALNLSDAIDEHLNKELGL